MLTLPTLPSQVFLYTLDFDVYTMQYGITSEMIQLPSSGLDRAYNCAIGLGNTLLAAGSHAGELVIFQTRTGVFRSCVPVSQGGLLSLTATVDPSTGRCTSTPDTKHLAQPT